MAILCTSILSDGRFTVAGSLREQLLKAGLVDGQKTKQVEAEKRKAQKQREYQAAQAAHRRELEQAAAAKVEKDR
ncbi:MAG: DUF2058 family protein, partial [Pseudomonadota bacterium]